MAKVKVHEIAKEFDIQSKDVIAALDKIGVTGKTASSGLEDDEAVRRLGARYRETVLALGGSKSALDVFRDFRGRDPEIAALLRQQDLV